MPFAYQYEASGIGVYEKHETLWYRRSFALNKAQAKRRALLCFNGSDYMTDVWVNGKHAVTHVGGYSPFSADITQFVKAGENTIVVRCIDPDDPTKPRGKQSWTGERFSCWYVPSSGIWQSVWIEFYDCDCISDFTVTPNVDDLSFRGEITTLRGMANELEITVSFGGKTVKRSRITLDGKYTRYSVALTEDDIAGEVALWTPDNPNLYYVDLTLYCDGKAADAAHTRFGMRNIKIDNGGTITLNNRKLYQRLVLDQGYWKESGTTPPSAQALKDDILAAKAMGFNGARKHQKLEDPYFYYYADELGFLTWCEMPSAYHFCSAEMSAVYAEWNEIVRASRAFTSVICYVPLNESWGVRKIQTNKDQQNFAAALYYMTKSIDDSRLVSCNDGWEAVDTTDIIGIHDYSSVGDGFKDKYRPENYDTMYPQGIKLMAQGHSAAG
ncbi:MAG: glycoside hydrolase family 2, partial [Clostridiales bacterium]|nr:glycoside hydrolase family 2 [Clostridiales bacterium]